MPEHTLTLSRENAGKSVLGGGSFFSAIGRCSCGWRTRVNQTPSRGGHAEVRRQHKKHVEETRQEDKTRNFAFNYGGGFRAEAP